MLDISRTCRPINLFEPKVPPDGAWCSAYLLFYLKCPRLEVHFSQFHHTDGLDTSGNFISASGTLFPIALCGRSSLYSLRQASNFSDASSSSTKQRAFRHSAWNKAKGQKVLLQGTNNRQNPSPCDGLHNQTVYLHDVVPVNEPIPSLNKPPIPITC
jgi:hypothetical protein